MEINKDEDINIVCTILNNQNKKYVLAVANALKFTQDNEARKNRNNKPPAGRSA